MRAVVNDFSTDIYPTEAEVSEFCMPGRGADTCIWLLIGTKGFECCCLNKPYYLLDRWLAGLTAAKRNGCSRVHTFKPEAAGLGEWEIP